MDQGSKTGLVNPGKRLQEAVTEELGAALRQELSRLQQGVCLQLENLKNLAVQNVEASFESHFASAGEGEKPSQATAQNGNVDMPLRPEMVPREVEDLEILNMRDMPLVCNGKKTASLSVVPTAVSALENGTFSPVKPQPLQANGSMTEDFDAACKQHQESLANWKFGFDCQDKDKENDEPQDFIDVVKAAVFADPAAMKEKMRRELLHHSHTTTVKYKHTGLAQRLARSPWFDFITAVVISFNIVWMAVDLDLNNASTLTSADTVFVVMDNVFCTYFLIELLIRFFAFFHKKDCLKDHWFCFDAALVLLMVVETWVVTLFIWLMDVDPDTMFGNYQNASILRIFRLARLSKISRIAKLYQQFPELMTMVRGFKFAARTVFLCFVLVLSVIYIWALLFRELTGDLEVGHKYFNSVPDSMLTLLFQGTMPDVESFIRDVAEGTVIASVLLVIFMFLITFTLINMLIGVIVGVVSEIADAERERRTVGFVKHKLQKVFKCREIDKDFDGTISEAEFETFLTHPVSIEALTSVGVDVVGLVDISEFIFKMDSDKVLSFSDLLELVLNLRGSNTATVKDVVDLRMFLTSHIIQMETRIAKQMRRWTTVLSENLKVSDKLTPAVKLTEQSPVRPAPIEPVTPTSAPQSLKTFC